MTQSVRDWAARDREFVGLVKACRLDREDPVPASDLAERFLPELLSGTVREFPTVEAADVLFHAWDLIFPVPSTRKKNKLTPVEDHDSPCGWLLHCVRRRLRSELLAEKHGVPEAWVRNGLIRAIREKGWVKATRDELAAGADVPLVYRIGDQELSDALARSTSRSDFHPVFEEVNQLLLCSGWPAAEASYAVEVVESRARRGAFSRGEVRKDLSDLSPALRDALLDFVAERDGYVYLRLKGLSPTRILDRSSVVRGQQRLAWPTTVPQRVLAAV